MPDLLQVFEITYTGQPYNSQEYPGSASNALGTALARRHIWFRWAVLINTKPEKVFHLISHYDSLSEIKDAIEDNKLDNFYVEPYGSPVSDIDCLECSGSGTIDNDGPTHWCPICNGMGYLK